MLIRIVDQIDLNEVYQYLESPNSGAMNLFVGTVRNASNGKKVVKLSFESYQSMALSELEKLGKTAKEKWDIDKVVILHVEGEKKIGEPVVVIGVSSAHRQASFEACHFLIDELKKKVPIWKKEFYEDESVWVNAHP
ncbi:MAG TPA: molybdenum cofactor biosynthesis protein MoaE [Balneolales bacterium]|nr:molybdenum cofactor biosynthesis protein MoaE [Balneolales bacterium]